MEKFYEFIAEMIAYLVNTENKDFYKKYNSRIQEERKREQDKLYIYVPGLFESDTKHLCQIDHMNVQQLHKGAGRLFSDCKDQKDHRCLLRLLEVLDAGLERQMMWELESIGEDAFEGGLNHNWKLLKLGILPRCSCYWEREHRGSQHYDRIENFFKNILIIDYRPLVELKVINHFLPANTFWKAEQKGSLAIAVSPLKLQNDFSIKPYVRDETCYFSVHYTGNVDNDNRRIESIIDNAAKEQADILVFPEMLGNTMMTERISEYLQDPSWLSGNKPPALIVLPSVWKEHTNISYLLNHTGNIICGQSKQEAYQEPIQPEGSAYEDIFKDNIVHLIHCIGIGRMVIMICKDFITKDYLETLLRELKVTMILIPSYSSGYHDFETMAGALRASDCCAVWVNACEAVKNRQDNKKVGFVLRSGRNTGRELEYVCTDDICKTDRCEELCLKMWKLYFKTVLGR